MVFILKLSMVPVLGPGILVLMCHLVRQLLLRVLWNYSFSYATTVVVNIVFFFYVQYFSVKMMDGIIATSYKEGDKFYIDPMKLLPLSRFLPQPKYELLLFLLHCLLAVLWKMEPRCLIHLLTFFFVFALDSKLISSHLLLQTICIWTYLNCVKSFEKCQISLFKILIVTLLPRC